MNEDNATNNILKTESNLTINKQIDEKYENASNYKQNNNLNDIHSH